MDQNTPAENRTAPLTPTLTFSPTPSPAPDPTPVPTATPTPQPTATPTPTPIPTATPTPPPVAVRGECSDGVDNDGDGQVDFADHGGSAGAALGCFGPNAQETATDYGFTLFTPSSDTRIVYVSSSDGHDSNVTTLCSTPQTACATLAAGKSLIRRSYPDWLLLKRGDVWNESFDQWYPMPGRSVAERQVIGAYGASSARPLIRTSDQNGISFSGGGGYAPTDSGNVALVGLHFQSTGGGVGIFVLLPGADFLVEDCEIDGYANNLTFDIGPFVRPKLRRNVIHDSLCTGRCQGIFMAASADALFEENVFDHNAYVDYGDHMGPQWDNHTGYISWHNDRLVFRGNIVARADGIYSGGGTLAEDNLFLRTVIALNLVPLNTGHSIARRNVFIEGMDFDVLGQIGGTEKRGYAIWVNNPDGADVTDNLIAHQRVTAGLAFIDEASAASNSLFERNTVYDWRGQEVVTAFPNFDFNLVWSPTPAIGNNVDASGISFVDPACTAATYNASIGGLQTLEDFLDHLRQRSHLSWDNRYTAAAASDFIRACYRPTTDLGSPQVGAVPYR